jgi:hypothetical protein
MYLATFWAFFSQTHLVTLDVAKPSAFPMLDFSLLQKVCLGLVVNTQTYAMNICGPS